MPCDRKKNKSTIVGHAQTCVPTHSIRNSKSAARKSKQLPIQQNVCEPRHIHTFRTYKQNGLFVNKTNTCVQSPYLGAMGGKTTHSPKSSSPNFHSPFSTKMAARSNSKKRRFIILRFHGKPTIFSSKKHFTRFHNHFIQALHIMSRVNL